jgi:large subunit ribosomal protein L35
MPKMKTNRAAAKRFRATASGRVRRSKAGKSHIMRFKSARRLRRLKKNDMVADVDVPRIKLLMPYEF